MPDDLLTLLEKVEQEAKANQQLFVTSQTYCPKSRSSYPSICRTNPRLIAPNFTSGSQGASVPLGGADPSLHPNQQPLNGIPNPLAVSVAPHASTPTSVAIPGRPNMPDDPIIPHNGFATVEEGEKAFMHLLRKAGVDATWTWDQTMRAIITDPLYKALNTLSEKKACWQKVRRMDYLVLVLGLTINSTSTP